MGNWHISGILIDISPLRPIIDRPVGKSKKKETQYSSSSSNQSATGLSPMEVKWYTVGRLIEAICRLGTTIVRTAGWVFVSYFVYKSIEAIAGKDTKFNAVVDAVFKMGADRWTAYILTGGATFGFIRERKLRQKAILEHGVHMKDLEKTVNPARLSSGLTPDGRTPKKEKHD